MVSLLKICVICRTLSPHCDPGTRAVNTDRGVGGVGRYGFRLRGSVRGVGLIREKKRGLFFY
jgi:hypothetical protein